MATTYDKASLVMIPSGYKDDKLYSIKPTDGSGDFTFSRDGAGASPATRVNAKGLIEKGRENVLLQSNQFDTTWTPANGASVTSGQSGYDGSNDAWLLTKPATSFVNISQSVSLSGLYTYSIYLKAGTNTTAIVRAIGSADYQFFVDLSNGTSTFTSSSIINTNIEPIGGGWYRCSITFSDSALNFVLVYPEAPFGNTTAGTIYIQDAQLEQGLISTSYIETTTAPVSAGLLGDMPRLDYSGGATCPSLLLEPSRVNLFDHSEYMDGWSTSNAGVSTEENAITSPEGVVNAAKIKEDGTNAAHAVRQLTGPTLTSGTDYTFSFFAKKGERSIVALSNTIGASNDANCFFDLENGQVLTNTFNSASIEDFGNGWYRCIATDTADAADDYDTRIYTATADNQFSHQGVSGNGLYIYGLQLEAGSYPTSYIPTYGSAVTRNDDVCRKENATDLIGQTEGSFFMEFEMDLNNTIGTPVCISEYASTSNFILVYQLQANSLSFRIRVNSVDQLNITSSTLSEGKHKFAFAYKENNCVFYIDGVLIGTSTSNTIPSNLNRLSLVDVGSGINKVDSAVNQTLLFKTRLSNEELATLTTI